MGWFVNIPPTKGVVGNGPSVCSVMHIFGQFSGTNSLFINYS